MNDYFREGMSWEMRDYTELTDSLEIFAKNSPQGVPNNSNIKFSWWMSIRMIRGEMLIFTWIIFFNIYPTKDIKRCCADFTIIKEM